MASHPSPFYRHRQSTKTLDPTGQTAKFLYTILKQLDLKNIDWNEVAGNLDITNGHAARMRWSRFRAQIEGLDNSYSRKSGRKKDGEKKRKKDKQEELGLRRGIHADGSVDGKRLKTELQPAVKHEGFGSLLSKKGNEYSGRVKNEPQEDISMIDEINVHHPTVTTITQNTASLQPSGTVSSSQGRQVPVPHSGQGQQSRIMRNTVWKQSPGSFNGQMNTYWPQQFHHAGYPYSPYRATAAPFYHPNKNHMFGSPYPFANMYSNQGHSNHLYGQQAQQHQLNIAQTLTTNGSNPIFSGNTSNSINTPSSQMKQPQPQLASTVGTDSFKNVSVIDQIKNDDATTTGPSAKETPQTMDSAFEMAAQASYPWPFSEASLLQFSEQDIGTLDTIINDQNQKNGQPNEVSKPAVIQTDPPEAASTQATTADSGNKADHAEDDTGRQEQEVPSHLVQQSAEKKTETVNCGEDVAKQEDDVLSQSIFIKAEPDLLEL